MISLAIALISLALFGDHRESAGRIVVFVLALLLGYEPVLGGDNVLDSRDSRYFGLVPEDYIVGAVIQ